MTYSCDSGSTNLSNLCDASDWISYFNDLPIIASGSKKAHSTRTVFVSREHAVLLPPTTPARLTTSSLIEKKEFLPERVIFLSRSVWNSWFISNSWRTNFPLILLAS